MKLAESLISFFDGAQLIVQGDKNAPHEAKFLRLNAIKAQDKLGWRPKLGFEDTVSFTADWYARWARGEAARAITEQQIAAYCANNEG